MVSERKSVVVTRLLFIMLVILTFGSKVKGLLPSDFYQFRGPLIFQEEFDTLNTSRWQVICAPRAPIKAILTYMSNHPYIFPIAYHHGVERWQ